MAANKSKKQFQGKNRRFRGDVWLDEKVSGRTMHALQERGVKFPPGTNVRGTREFKDEFKRQARARREDRGKKRSRKGSAGSSPAARSRRNCSVINGYTICLGTDLYK